MKDSEYFRQLVGDVFRYSNKIKRIVLEVDYDDLMWYVETDKPPNRFYFPVKQEDHKAFLGTRVYINLSRLHTFIHVYKENLIKHIGYAHQLTLHSDGHISRR